MSNRPPYMIIAVGQRWAGKTYLTTQIMYKYWQGDAKKGIKPQRVLIFDVNDEFQQIKTMPIRYVPVYSYHPIIDIRRISPIKDNGQKMSNKDKMDALNFIIEHYKNGLLIIEDMNKFISDSITKDFYGQIISLRHANCDIYIHVQTKGKAGNPKLFPNANYIRLHKTGDKFGRHQDKFKDYLEILQLAEILVDQENHKLPEDKQYFYCYINKDKQKIEGMFSRDAFTEAIDKYLSEEHAVVTKLANSKNKNGQKNYASYRDAYDYLSNQLFTKYYGNG